MLMVSAERVDHRSLKLEPAELKHIHFIIFC